MPYVIVEGILEPKKEDSKQYFSTSVSGLKVEEVNELVNFSPKPSRDNYTLNFCQHPCVILNALEVLGFQVICSTSGKNNSVIWTMLRDFDK